MSIKESVLDCVYLNIYVGENVDPSRGPSVFPT